MVRIRFPPAKISAANSIFGASTLANWACELGNRLHQEIVPPARQCVHQRLIWTILPEVTRTRTWRRPAPSIMRRVVPARPLPGRLFHQMDGRAHRRPERWLEGQGAVDDLLDQDGIPPRDRQGHLRSRPSSWWRFETEAEAPRVQGRWWKVVCGRRGGRERDRRHGGLCCGRSAAIKPCAFGAPLRGCGA